MRWDAQAIAPTREPAPETAGSPAPGPAPAMDALLPLAGLVRSVSTPEFSGVTFHEVTAKSVLNKVPSGSNMPFEWTVNPYRGCSHACVYCFARKSHTYLEFDAGRDFDSQVVVKINAAEVLRKELAKPSWGRHQVALGTNTDPYQRAEGRYALMPDIIRALADSGTPFSILTKGTLLARDIPLLKHAATMVPVDLGISLAMTNQDLAALIEPGTPSPKARLKLIARLREAGLGCGVMAMPVLPWLTDSDEALDSLFAGLAQAGATGVSAGALYLKPGTREWYMKWLAAEHPELVGKYRRLYGNGWYASKEYRAWLSGRTNYFKAKYGFTGSSGFSHRNARYTAAQAASPAGAAAAPLPGQESLF
ncbi:Rv2578c family radical SAM protein [Paenarthrobacter sp. JL.01a]|uniref:Rv2578c family radical SAM protein n=1 Tax=Paenarthrobacter sp. JL.01a TaxID=2979324 RepID=UPI0021CA4F83|nr:Rv2578c family radical SAM protein [Paenarthrobacter sp. JL.01a]UXM93250.1 Rv2578c family radical SAM protein [Paenarthrobacter sp. JL.01a]